MKTRTPNIIFFDIETAPIVATTWTLYPKSLSHDNILKDSYIICAAWKSGNSKKVHSAAITKTGNDYECVKAIREGLKDADVLVGHNLDKFDMKRFNARLIFHGLPPLPRIPTVDTLKSVKKVATFTSHRLDYLAKTLIGKGKIKTEYNLWLDVISGNKAALRKMVVYCKMDVVRLEQIYDKLLPYFLTHPHVGAIMGKDRKVSCPKCGSLKLKRNGIRYTATGMQRQECQCQSCGSYTRVTMTALG
jgi:DNA polymerase elongation subunit (family B)